MNIFRILASGKHKFREEYVSAVLAYLLSPKMDHGLGAAFLDTLLKLIAQKTEQEALKQLIAQFQNKLREDLFSNQSSHPLVEMEFPYPIPGKSKGFIDIVIRCDDWFILVENKIHVESTSKDQLKDQYEGFRRVLDDQKLSDSKVLSIYLVPAIGDSEEWRIAQTSLDEIDFEVQDGDLISLVTWQPADDEDNISIVGCVREMLNKESEGGIPPMSFEVRHLLLSLIDFTIGDFQGFPYDRTTPKSGPPDQMKVSDVLERTDDLYIGIQYGIAGTIVSAWKNKGFLDREVKVTEDANRGWQYLPLNDFKTVARWAIPGFSAG